MSFMLQRFTLDEATYHLLQHLFKVPHIRKNFALAGGTALALQLGHRKSIDLDLFSRTAFLPAETEGVLMSISDWQFRAMAINENMLYCMIDNIKCDFLFDPYPQIDPPLESDQIRLYSVADIAAMKLKAISGRGSKKDFFYLYALLTHYSWEQLQEWFISKYGDAQLFYMYKSVQYFEDANQDPEIVGLKKFAIPWEEVKQIITRTCKP